MRAILSHILERFSLSNTAHHALSHMRLFPKVRALTLFTDPHSYTLSLAREPSIGAQTNRGDLSVIRLLLSSLCWTNLQRSLISANIGLSSTTSERVRGPKQTSTMELTEQVFGGGSPNIMAIPSTLLASKRVFAKNGTHTG